MTAGHRTAPAPVHTRPILVYMCMPINGHARCAATFSYYQVLARVSGLFASVHSFKILVMALHVTLQLLFTSVPSWCCLVY